MKTTLLLTMALNITLGAFAQGTLNVGNSVTGIFRAPIYSAPYTVPGFWTIRSGQSSLGIPSGSTAYPGPLIQGTGYTFAVYYGAASVTDDRNLSLLVETTFRTAAGNVLPAGLIRTVNVVVPGVNPGMRAKLQVRVWNNQGGTITSWDWASYRNASSMFISEPLGGLGTGGPVLTPDMTGWASFDVPILVPEPSAWAIGLFVSATLLIRRPRWHDSVSMVVQDGDQRLTKTRFSQRNQPSTPKPGAA